MRLGSEQDGEKQGTDKTRDDRLTKEGTTMTDDGWRRREDGEKTEGWGRWGKKKNKGNKRGAKVVAQVADTPRGRQ